MAKDPAFLFYSSDFLSGTMLLSDEQVGKYIRLLCLQHQKGHLTEKDMLKICFTHDDDIFSKFIKDDAGLFYNARLDEEVRKRIAYSDSRRKNREKKDMSNICESYVEHMENENENINDTVNKGSKRGAGREKGPLDRAIANFKEHRKKLRKPMTEHAIDLFMKKLDVLGKTDVEKIAVIEQSIERGWTGIFPLDEKKPQGTFGAAQHFSRPTENYDHLAVDPFKEE